MSEPTSARQGVRVAHTVAALREAVTALRGERGGGRVALVATMGALHRGHLSLVERARELADEVVVSIFVNPRQFAPHEDLATYPRTLDADCALLASMDVPWVFAPSAAEMYPDGFQTEVRVRELGAGLCGRSRPHFFGGVALVVLKLLNAAMADVAVFGEKDWQQLCVIRRLARDLDHPTQIASAPLVRDADGLALSSRNAYLSAQTRRAALALPRALLAATERVAAGERDAAVLVRGAVDTITAAGGLVDYVEVVDPDALTPIETLDVPARMLAAVHFDGTRLIDNVALLVPS